MVGSNLFSVAGRQRLRDLNRGVEHQDGRMSGSEVKSIPGTHNLRRNSGLPVLAATEMSGPELHAFLHVFDRGRPGDRAVGSGSGFS